MLSRKLYYLVKPFFSRRTQIAFRRFHARRVLRRSGDVWPIKEDAARRPVDWPGWPEGNRFGLVLTHDVEGPRGIERVKHLAELEMKLGFRSSFNFVPEGGYPVPPELRSWLTEHGFEVGVQDLHHDAKLYRSREHFAESARRINQYIKQWGASGFRSAFMLHNLEWLHDLNVLYDSSTFDTDPFEPQPDGMDTIFPFWVPAGGQRSEVRGQRSEASAVAALYERRPAKSGSNGASRERGYVELPYTLVQDFNLFIILRAKTIDIWRRKLDWIVQNQGMVLLDTHPDYMAFDGVRPQPVEYPAERYAELLTYIKKKYAGIYWHALPRQVAQYVIENRESARSSSSHAHGVATSLQRGAVVSHQSPDGLVATPAPATVQSRLHDGKTADAPDGALFAASSADHGTDVSPLNGSSRLPGKRAAVLLFSHYPADPRPRRAAEALVAEGVSVDLICLQENEDEPRRETVNGVRIFRVPLRRQRGSRVSYVAQYSAFILSSFACLATRAFKERYDVVHVHNMPDVLVFSALVPKLLGAKVILDLHDPMPELMQTIFKLPEKSFGVNVLKLLEKWSIAFADSVLTVNLACKEIYSSRSCRPEKINVVLNSPDEKIFQFRGPNPNAVNGSGNGAAPPFKILYHGSLVRRNGFDLAVDALETVHKTVPTARLVVCGQRTPYFDSVMETAEQRGLSNHVEYLGALKIEQIVDAINACDLGIIPNHRNIFTEINTPTRIFEYLALGKPVIAPRAKGIQDYFGDKDLLFFELGDAADLADKIEFAFHHRDELIEIVRRGQAVYRTHMWSREKAVLLKAVNDLV